MSRAGNETRPLELRSIDGVRGVAAAMVVAYHAWLYSPKLFFGMGLGVPALDLLLRHLWVGVTVFFVLSGFLLYRPFVAASLTGTPRPGIRRYALNRVLRIVPAYYFVLTVTLLVSRRGLLDGPSWNYVKDYLFMQTYSRPEFILGPAWTLCIEVSFYAFLPLFAIVAARVAAAPTLRERARRQLAASAALVVAGIAYQTVAIARPLPTALPQFIHLFAIGMMLATIVEWRRAASSPKLTPRQARIVLVAALPAVAVATLVPHANSVATYLDPLPSAFFDPLIALATALALGSMLEAARATTLSRALSLKPLAALGTVSYGLYLWHEPLILELRRHHLWLAPRPAPYLVNFALAATLGTAAALVSWRLVERPALRLKRCSARDLLRPPARAWELAVRAAGTR